MENVLIKVRSMAHASESSKEMARRKLETLRPYKPRPQTTSLVASKIIGASLGMNNLMSKEKMEAEKNKLKEAKGKKKATDKKVESNL
jgi:hypothetical protein